MTDPIESLQAIVNEVKMLRDRVEGNKALMQNIAIRLALHQLDHGAIKHASDDQRWGDLLLLAESGTLRVAHDCTVILGNRELSTETLGEARPKP